MLNGGSYFEGDGFQHLAGTITVGANGGALAATWNNKGLYVNGVISGSGPLALNNSTNNIAGTGNNGNLYITASNSYTGVVSLMAV